uniref:Uncharacterized protein n=2 Tax=Anguilla anguilla TaxID=7936 RepID=A0A0E9VJT6_ANGAN
MFRRLVKVRSHSDQLINQVAGSPFILYVAERPRATKVARKMFPTVLAGFARQQPIRVSGFLFLQKF